MVIKFSEGFVNMSLLSDELVVLFRMLMMTSLSSFLRAQLLNVETADGTVGSGVNLNLSSLKHLMKLSAFKVV